MKVEREKKKEMRRSKPSCMQEDREKEKGDSDLPACSDDEAGPKEYYRYSICEMKKRDCKRPPIAPFYSNACYIYPTVPHLSLPKRKKKKKKKERRLTNKLPGLSLALGGWEVKRKSEQIKGAFSY